jgi:hypothetical protein
MGDSAHLGMEVSTSIADLGDKVLPARAIDIELGGLLDEMIELVEGRSGCWWLPRNRRGGQRPAQNMGFFGGPLFRLEPLEKRAGAGGTALHGKRMGWHHGMHGGGGTVGKVRLGTVGAC